MDNLTFLNEEEVEEVAVAPNPGAVEQPVEATPERPRDEHGRFAPKDEKPEPVMVPLAALHETRDKVRDLEARLAAQQQPTVQTPPATPDVFEDPEGFTTAIQQQIKQAVYAERLNFSHATAAQKYGDETVQAAIEWGRAKCGSDPYFNATVMDNPDPVGFAVQQYQREQIASSVDLSEYEQFKAWKAAQAQAQTVAPVAAVQAPPRSIATAPSSGGIEHVPTGPGQAFDSVFNR